MTPAPKPVRLKVTAICPGCGRPVPWKDSVMDEKRRRWHLDPCYIRREVIKREGR